MNDETDNKEVTSASAKPDGPVAGQRLGAARREQQISIVEVAKELHLDEPKVRALEHNDFEVLGAPVFAKGHLRKYAQLVGVSIEDVLTEYYLLNRTPNAPPVVGRVRRPHREMSPGPWVAMLALLAIAAAAYWWFSLRETPPAAPTQEPIMQSPVEAPAPEAEQPGVDDAEPAADEPASEAIATSEAPPEPATTVAASADTVVDAPVNNAAPPTVGEGESRLTLTFSGECWTEITDADGRRLFFDLGRDGRVVDLAGVAPFSVVFGDADSVRIDVDGVPYAISPSDRSGQMARLTIFTP